MLKEKHPQDKELRYFAMRLKWLFERACRLKDEYLTGGDVDARIKCIETDTIEFLSKDFAHEKLKTLVK